MNYYGNYQNFTPTTNKIYVTGRDDAMTRFSQPNTIMVYFSQDEKTAYEVTTDNFGRKTLEEIDLSRKTTTVQDEYIKRTEFDELKEKLERIESILTSNSRKKAVTKDDE